MDQTLSSSLHGLLQLPLLSWAWNAIEMIFHGESVWKLGIGVLALLLFFCLGVAHVIAPDYFIRRSAVRKGGELLTDSNRIGFQIVGILVALFAAGIFYDIAKDLFSR